MPAPRGNNYWQFRNKHGRDFEYQPEELWDEFVEYCKWIEKYPLYEVKAFGSGIKMKVPKMRAMTIKGFCSFADIDHLTFDSYSKKEGFVTITRRIRNSIDNQKIEGAAAGLLETNIIAMEMGLKQKFDHTTGDEKFDFNSVSSNEALAGINELLKLARKRAIK